MHGRKIKLEIGVKKDRVKKDDVSAPEPAVEAEEQTQVTAKAISKVSAKDSEEVAVATANKGDAPAELKPTADGASEASIKRSRQILVFGIPVDINKKAFKMTVSKISKKTDVELIKEVRPLPSTVHCIRILHHSHSSLDVL